MTALLTHPLPTRRDEAWRYADLAAIEPVWPVVPEPFDVAAGEAARRTLVLDQPVTVLDITLAAGARLDIHVVSAGAASRRCELTVTLGAGAQFHLGAVQIASGSATVELITKVVHASPDAVSRQVVRSLAAGRGVANYLGKVVVQPGADGTDGEQSVRALLLNRGAAANARPELEIHADDVQCAHGCAVGELDAAALFYLAARGIGPVVARRLLLQAFLAEALLGLDDGDALLADALATLEAAA